MDSSAPSITGRPRTREDSVEVLKSRAVAKVAYIRNREKILEKKKSRCHKRKLEKQILLDYALAHKEEILKAVSSK